MGYCWAMGKVLQMKSKHQELLEHDEAQVMYLYGETLRFLEEVGGGDPEKLFDTDGTPVLNNEYYEITAGGIKRL